MTDNPALPIRERVQLLKQAKADAEWIGDFDLAARIQGSITALEGQAHLIFEPDF